MLKLGLLTMSFVLASCSGSPFKEQTARQERLNAHMSQPKKYIGGDFNSKFNSSGNDGFVVRAIGRSLYPVAQSEHLARAASISDAKFKLVQSAPTEFKTLVQKAIGNSLGYTGEFTQIETSISEVQGLKGIDVKEEDVECRVVISPNSNGDYDNHRECRSIASVQVAELSKAYDFTMSQKYGDKAKSAVEKLLEDQLRKQAMK